MSEAPEYLIRKHGGYYRANCRGYTDDFLLAGRYTLEEAERETHPNGPDGPRDGMTYVHQKDVQRDPYDITVLGTLPEAQALVATVWREGWNAALEAAAKAAKDIGRDDIGWGAIDAAAILAMKKIDQ
jgi:hypothetical protein